MTLNKPATEDATITLQTLNPAASVPSSVVVPAGDSTASFVIETSAVTAATTGDIRASWNLRAFTQPLTINPVTVQVALAASSIVGNPGRILSGSITLDQVVNHPVEVSLTSYTSAVSVPATVTVEAGQSSAAFDATSLRAVEATIAGTRVRGTYAGKNSDAFFDVLPPDVATVTVNPTSVVSGGLFDVTVTFNSPVPEDGQVLPKKIVFTSGQIVGSTVAVIPSDDPATPGVSEWTFQVQTKPQGTEQQIQVVVGGMSSEAVTLLPKAPQVQSVVFTPLSGYGPKTVTGKITLDMVAPAEGLQVSIQTSSPGVTLSTQTVSLSGTTTGSFTMNVPITAEDRTVEVQAVINVGDTPVVGTFELLAPRIHSVSVINGGAAPGQIATVRVVLTGKVPPGGLQVTIADDGSGNLSFPYGTVARVLEGYSSANLKVKVNAGAVPGTSVPCTATLVPYAPVPFELLVLSG